MSLNNKVRVLIYGAALLTNVASIKPVLSDTLHAQPKNAPQITITSENEEIQDDTMNDLSSSPISSFYATPKNAMDVDLDLGPPDSGRLGDPSSFFTSLRTIISTTAAFSNGQLSQISSSLYAFVSQGDMPPTASRPSSITSSIEYVQDRDEDEKSTVAQ